MIIAIGHRKRTGKNRFATFLAEALRGTSKYAFNKKPITILPMADSLKAACAVLYPGILFEAARYEDGHPQQLDKDAAIPELGGRCARDIWLDVGTLLHKYDPVLLARTVTTQAPRDQHGCIHGHMITPDLRRLAEVQHYIDSDPVVFVRVDRYTGNGEPYALPDPGIHTLDNELAEFTGWHVIVRNSGDLGALHEKAVRLAELLKSGGLSTTCLEL